jgi:hypothetical protein
MSNNSKLQIHKHNLIVKMSILENNKKITEKS